MAEPGHAMSVWTETVRSNLNGDQLGPEGACKNRGQGRRHLFTRLVDLGVLSARDH